MLHDKRWERKAKTHRPRNLADVYNAAADVIQERGHSRGQLIDDAGRMCLWGAISFVMTGNPMTNTGASHRAVENLRSFIPGDHKPIAWNNQAERTKRQVVSLLRRAAVFRAKHNS